MKYKPVTSRLETLRAAYVAYEVANAEFTTVEASSPRGSREVDAAWEKVMMAEVTYSSIINRCD